MAPGCEDPIIREAAEAERRMKKKAKREDLKRKKQGLRKKKLQPKTHKNRERWITWWRVQVPIPNFSRVFLIIYLVMCIASFGIIFASDFITRFFYSLPLVSIFRYVLFSGIALILAGIASCLRFSFWRARLPFALTGWEELVDFIDFGEDEAWRHCTIVIRFSRENPVAEEAFRAALVIFSEKANRCYYPSNDSNLRKEWESGSLTASGSVNRHVARKIKNLCEGNLARQQCAYGGLDKVMISSEGKSFHVSRPSNDNIDAS